MAIGEFDLAPTKTDEHLRQPLPPGASHCCTKQTTTKRTTVALQTTSEVLRLNRIKETLYKCYITSYIAMKVNTNKIGEKAPGMQHLNFKRFNRETTEQKFLIFSRLKKSYNLIKNKLFQLISFRGS